MPFYQVPSTQETFVVTGPDQAACLRQGLRMPGVEELPNPADLNLILERVEYGYIDGAIIPEELHDTAQGLACLVLKTELKHVQGLIESGQVTQASMRLESQQGLAAKFGLLKTFLEKSPLAE